jgi:[acyl-carrier-protein] S-malonyltransferase
MVSEVCCCCYHLLLLVASGYPQVGADKAIKIANFLCPGNYAVSGSIEGCEAVERLGKDPRFKARMTVSVRSCAD